MNDDDRDDDDRDDGDRDDDDRDDGDRDDGEPCRNGLRLPSGITLECGRAYAHCQSVKMHRSAAGHVWWQAQRICQRCGLRRMPTEWSTAAFVCDVCLVDLFARRSYDRVYGRLRTDTPVPGFWRATWDRRRRCLHCGYSVDPVDATIPCEGCVASNPTAMRALIHADIDRIAEAVAMTSDDVRALLAPFLLEAPQCTPAPDPTPASPSEHPPREPEGESPMPPTSTPVDPTSSTSQKGRVMNLVANTVGELRDTAWLAAADEVIDSALDPVIHMLLRRGVPKAWGSPLRRLLRTDFGRYAFGLALGHAIELSPLGSKPVVQKLGRTIRVVAAKPMMGALFQLVTGPLREIVVRAAEQAEQAAPTEPPMHAPSVESVVQQAT